MNKAVATKQTAEVLPVTPMDMLQVAVQQGADIDKLEKLMELERRWKADQAREAYVVAMNAFRAESLEVVKNKHVSYTTSKGTTEYRHATLAEAVGVASPALSKHGLSHRWETAQANGSITVTCFITHQLGHSESTSLTASADDSGGKNSIQAIGSTVAYLERYTFMAITGLAARDMDNDGGKPLEPLTEKQLGDLEALITEVGADRAAFLRYMKVESLEDMPERDYKRAVQALERKR